MKKKYYIYEHYTKDTNVVFYVGYGQNNRAYDCKRRNKYWKNVYNKHGLEVKVLKSNLLLDEAIELEQELIEKYGRRDIGTGTLTNLTAGGEGLRNASPETRKKLSYIASNISDETREKMRNSARNRPPMKEETKQKLREKFSGKSNPNYGKNFSDIHRKRLSEAHKGIKLKDETKEKLRAISSQRRHSPKTKAKLSEMKKKKVIQYSLDGDYITTYDSIQEAVVVSGAKNVSACVRGKRNHSGGYRWAYKESVR